MLQKFVKLKYEKFYDLVKQNFIWNSFFLQNLNMSYFSDYKLMPSDQEWNTVK